ncbi:hypothetical protein MPSEU_000598200 [Mayamaea pseudoterrestris]|nr:hypothetical protein MPSEU_000598200 [Mayamaea pseudoterrestris]
MAHALPLAKLGGLLIKTLAKPLSKRVKHEFSRSPFTQNILVAIGQGTHQLTSRMTIWSAGYKVRSIKPLEEEQAIKQGAEFVGEGFILTVSIGVLMYEYNSQTTKAREKDLQQKAKAQAERDELQTKLHALDVRLKALEVVVKNNSNSLLNVIGKKYKQPEEAELVPIELRPIEEVQATDPTATTLAAASNEADASIGRETGSLTASETDSLTVDTASSGSWRKWWPWS